MERSLQKNDRSARSLKPAAAIINLPFSCPTTSRTWLISPLRPPKCPCASAILPSTTTPVVISGPKPTPPPRNTRREQRSPLPRGESLSDSHGERSRHAAARQRVGLFKFSGGSPRARQGSAQRPSQPSTNRRRPAPAGFTRCRRPRAPEICFGTN